MGLRKAFRIARNETTNELEISRCAFLWDDVFMIEDDSDNKVGYHKPMTWIRTTEACFYIEGDFDTLVAEWEAHEASQYEHTLLFSRS